MCSLAFTSPSQFVHLVTPMQFELSNIYPTGGFDWQVITEGGWVQFTWTQTRTEWQLEFPMHHVLSSGRSFQRPLNRCLLGPRIWPHWKNVCPVSRWHRRWHWPATFVFQPPHLVTPTSNYFPTQELASRLQTPASLIDILKTMWTTSLLNMLP